MTSAEELRRRQGLLYVSGQVGSVGRRQRAGIRAVAAEGRGGGSKGNAGIAGGVCLVSSAEMFGPRELLIDPVTWKLDYAGLYSYIYRATHVKNYCAHRFNVYTYVLAELMRNLGTS